jgi:hypothetical protein
MLGKELLMSSVGTTLLSRSDEEESIQILDVLENRVVLLAVGLRGEQQQVTPLGGSSSDFPRRKGLEPK